MENTEIWKDVIGYEGLYKVSNLGGVKSFYFGKEKLLKGLLNNKGYCQVNLYNNKNVKRRTIHQLVAESFLNHTPCGFKLVIDHKDTNPQNNMLENLQIITQRENTNKKRLHSSSKYVGVSFDNHRKKFCASIYVKPKRIFLGAFDGELEASEYYQNALKSIENNSEIIIKKPIYSSKYKGVSWHKRDEKWHSRIIIKGKTFFLGSFNSEIEAYNTYKEAKLLIST